MSSKNILFTVIVVVLAFSIVGYLYYASLQKSNKDPFLYVPEDAAVILQFDQPGKVFGKLLSDTSIWETLTQTQAFGQLESDILHLGSFLNAKPAYFQELNESPLIVSFLPDENLQTTHFLLVSKLGTAPFRKDIKAFLEQNLGEQFDLSEFNGDDFSGFVISSIARDHDIVFTITDGVLIASSEKEIIEKAILTAKNPNTHFSQSEDFIQLYASSGSKVDARLFIQYRNLGDLLKSYTQESNYDALGRLNNFASWTETDLHIKNDEFLFSGFTRTHKDGDEYLNHFNRQLSNEDKTINLLPFNTNFSLRLGFSDYQSYYTSTVKGNLKESDLKFTDQISRFIGKEINLASNAMSEGEIDEKTWAIVRLQSKKKGRDVINNLARKLSSKTTKYEEYTIGQFEHPQLLTALFGDLFSVIRNNYYVFIGDYVVFGNSPNSLIRLLQTYNTGKTLDLSNSYKLFSDNLSTTANVTLYINPTNIINLLPRFLNEKTFAGFQENAETMSHFKGLAFQYSSGEPPMFYSNFYLSHGSTKQSDNISQWKLNLSDEISGQPHIVRDHNTDKYNVIAFDKSANMYLISTDGIILWKKRIDNIPISDIHEVDYFKNGKIQYLFNTADFVYLIDKNGEMVKNYPRKLNPSATNGLSLFDYNNNREYRLMISQSDKWTYNYNIDGSQVKGWQKPRMDFPVNQSITRLVINNKDYFIITDENNNIKIVNRKGEVRIDLNESPNKAKNSAYYANKTNNKGIIITTNESGKLTYFNTNGQLKHTDFGEFSPQHFFLYEDFNNDGSLDFIFLDKDELKVFNRLKKEIFNYKFQSEIKIKPVFFKAGKNQKVLGIVADSEKTIYLFDDKGNTIISKGLIGETPFTVGSLNNNNEMNLVTASGNVLYNYRLN